jgi:hypothetical protein
MAIREEATGKFLMGDENVSPEMIEEMEAFRASQQDFENKMRIEEENRRLEKWANKAIMPFGQNIMIEPYTENPYMRKVHDSGIILDSSRFTNPDSGKDEDRDLGIKCAKVIEVGPDVKHVRKGDEILCVAARALPVPFMNTGFMLMNEGHVICIINTNDVLIERFKHLSDD